MTGPVAAMVETTPNRRDFVRGVATAAAWLYAGSRGLAAAGAASLQSAAPAARRLVSIEGRRVKVVDLHAHATRGTWAGRRRRDMRPAGSHMT